MQQKLTAAAVLFAALALAACGGSPATTTPQPTPAPSADVSDDTDDGAKTLASVTFKTTAAQAHALGISALAAAAPTAPVSVTLAVKQAKEGTKYAGQKRAFLGWKLYGKTFPAVLTGTTSGTYSLALVDAAGQPVKSGAGKDLVKKGALSVALPLASGTLNTSRSRSTSYATTAGACAVAAYSLSLPDGSSDAQGSEQAPLMVCEPGVTPPAPAPAQQPAATLEGVTLATWFYDGGQGVEARARLDHLPSGVNVATRYEFQDAEECGAGDRYGRYGSGSWSKIAPDTYAQAINEQDMVNGQGIAYTFTLTQDGQTRELSGLMCYRPELVALPM